MILQCHAGGCGEDGLGSKAVNGSCLLFAVGRSRRCGRAARSRNLPGPAWLIILSVGVVVAHVPDKCLVLFIFIPGEENRVGKPDNLVSLGVSNQDAIEFMSCLVLFYLQLYRLVITAWQAAKILEIMADEGGYNVIPVRHAADELLGLVSLHLAAACTVIDFKTCGQCGKDTENRTDNTGCPDQP